LLAWSDCLQGEIAAENNSISKSDKGIEESGISSAWFWEKKIEYDRARPRIQQPFTE